MCEAPIYKGPHAFACRKCSSCRTQRVQDYTGRCLCEAQTSELVSLMTLTYGDHPHAHYLVYRDVQLMLKALRFAGHPVRYLAAGEYGSLRARAHWHVLLFWQGKLPVLPEPGEKKSWAFWPHGFVHCQHPNVRGYRYVLKYVLKQQPMDGHTRTNNMGHLGLSKVPPLGHAYLTNLAATYARAGHLPPRPVYQVPGDPGYFWLLGTTRRNFLRAYAYAHWCHHGRPPRALPEWAELAISPTMADGQGSPTWEASMDAEREWRSWYGTETQQRHGDAFRAIGWSLRSSDRLAVFDWQERYKVSDLGGPSGASLCSCPDCRAWRTRQINRQRFVIDTPF